LLIIFSANIFVTLRFNKYCNIIALILLHYLKCDCYKIPCRSIWLGPTCISYTGQPSRIFPPDIFPVISSPREKCEDRCLYRS